LNGRRESDASVHSVAESIVNSMVATSMTRAVLHDGKDQLKAPGKDGEDVSYKRERDYASFCQSPSKEVEVGEKYTMHNLSHKSSHKEIDVAGVGGAGDKKQHGASSSSSSAYDHKTSSSAGAAPQGDAKHYYSTDHSSLDDHK
jgi:hypothetical protein